MSHVLRRCFPPLTHFSLSILPVLAGAALALGACVSDEQSLDDELAERSEPLATRSLNLWHPDPESGQTLLDVCFENGTSTYATEIGWVRDIVEATWDTVSWVNFRGWGACSGGEEVRVRIEDGVSRTEGFGVDYGKLYLNFTFKNWATQCASTRRSCIEAHAVHEFGHVLGFTHEQNRGDFETCADGTVAPAQSTDPYTYLTPVDTASVMSYCPENNWNALTANDIRGIKRAYGGSDSPVNSDYYYAIRGSGGHFVTFESDIFTGAVRVVPGAFMNHFLGMKQNTIRITRSAGAGPVAYGDSVALRDTSNMYLCVGNVNGRDGVIRTANSCLWKVEHISGSLGGSVVDVNDPLKLVSKSLLTPGSLYSFSAGGAAPLRILGPFAK